MQQYPPIFSKWKIGGICGKFVFWINFEFSASFKDPSLLALMTVGKIKQYSVHLPNFTIWPSSIRLLMISSALGNMWMETRLPLTWIERSGSWECVRTSQFLSIPFRSNKSLNPYEKISLNRCKLYKVPSYRRVLNPQTITLHLYHVYWTRCRFCRTSMPNWGNALRPMISRWPPTAMKNSTLSANHPSEQISTKMRPITLIVSSVAL